MEVPFGKGRPETPETVHELGAPEALGCVGCFGGQKFHLLSEASRYNHGVLLVVGIRACACVLFHRSKRLSTPVVQSLSRASERARHWPEGFE